MLKKVIFSILLFASTSTYSEDVVQEVSNPLIQHIAEEYSIDPTRANTILSKVSGLVDAKFPRKTDVLAIIAIESRFKSRARSSHGAKGLMQVLYKNTTTDWDNISAGVALLREYRKRLGSEVAAIHAYNVGIGNYLKGRRVSRYYSKYVVAKNKLQVHAV